MEDKFLHGNHSGIYESYKLGPCHTLCHRKSVYVHNDAYQFVLHRSNQPSQTVDMEGKDLDDKATYSHAHILLSEISHIFDHTNEQ